MKKLISLLGCFAMIVAAVGCNQNTATQTKDHDHHHNGTATGGIEPPQAPSPEGEKFVLSEAPDDVLTVVEAKSNAKDGEKVVLSGRIGGSQSPWIEERAAFTLVDGSLQSCEQIPGDNCPTPWDYCCRTDKLATSSALVKVVDDSGQIVETDARKLLGVRELTGVTVVGTAKRDDAGNLTVLARSVYVEKK